MSTAFSPDSTAHNIERVSRQRVVKKALKTPVFIANVIASCQTLEHVKITSRWIQSLEIDNDFRSELLDLIHIKQRSLFLPREKGC